MVADVVTDDVGVVVVSVVVCVEVWDVVALVVAVVVGVVRTQLAKLRSSNALTASLSRVTIASHSGPLLVFEEPARTPPARQVKVPVTDPRVND